MRAALVGRPTKTHQRRDIALDDATAAMLTRRLEDQRSYAEQVGVDLVPDPFVLSKHADGSAPYDPDSITDYFKRMAGQLGIKTHFHELRHFAATAAIASGADIRTVAGRLGHAQASTTLNIYAHTLEQRDRELADKLGSAVLGTNALPSALVLQTGSGLFPGSRRLSSSRRREELGCWVPPSWGQVMP